MNFLDFNIFCAKRCEVSNSKFKIDSTNLAKYSVWSAYSVIAKVLANDSVYPELRWFARHASAEY